MFDSIDTEHRFFKFNTESDFFKQPRVFIIKNNSYRVFIIKNNSINEDTFNLLAFTKENLESY